MAGGRCHLVAVQAHQCSGLAFVADGVDQQYGGRPRDFTHQRQAQGAAVEQANFRRQLEIPAQPPDDLDADTVVATQDIAQAQHDEFVHFSPFPGNSPLPGNSPFQRRQPEKIEPMVPFFSVMSINQAL